MKKFVIQIVILVIVIFTALYFGALGPAGRNFNLFPPSEGVPTRVALINGVRINVEVADTQEKRSKGLGDRQSLATDSGMLFVFPKDDHYRFWMKGLNFPLDMIWLNDNKVVEIMKNVPPPQPGQKDEDLPIFVPSQPADMVLEVNGGFVDQNAIRVGDSLEIQ